MNTDENRYAVSPASHIKTATRTVNLRRIGKYAACLYGIFLIIGILQGTILKRPTDAQGALYELVTDVAISLLVPAAVFLTLSVRHPEGRWLRAFQVMALYTAISQASGLLIEWVTEQTVPAVLIFVEWLGVLFGAVLGTIVGALVVRRAQPDS